MKLIKFKMNEVKIVRAAQPFSGDIRLLIEKVLTGLGLYHLRPENVDADIQDIERNYFNSNGFFWVVFDEMGYLIGSCALADAGNGICELKKMYLLPEAQGKGIGKKLMRMAIDKAIALGYSGMSLETNSKLEAAILLYQKFGFNVLPPKSIKADCDIVMQRIF